LGLFRYGAARYSCCLALFVSIDQLQLSILGIRGNLSAHGTDHITGQNAIVVASIHRFLDQSLAIGND